MHYRMIIVLFFLLLRASYAVSQDQSVSIPTNWKTKPPNDSGFNGGIKRFPLLVGSGVGYEFTTCTTRFEAVQFRVFTLGSCPTGARADSLPFFPDYSGFGGIPNTAFAVDSSYRFTMEQLSPYLESLAKRVDIVQLKANSLNKRLSDDEAELPGQIDQLAVQKLLEKINALEARVKVLESQLNAGKP